jgi:hypothetical protein
MTPDQLKSLQTPLKNRYRSQPETARAKLSATGIVDFADIRCRLKQTDSEHRRTANAGVQGHSSFTVRAEMPSRVPEMGQTADCEG